eukprot:CAMPEP_0201525554 /NCGR_PEP_ID=MMETSP0161_2-20130828/28642_1 /ASSEMBLY_ACC=CAM_ASM_000251 /TAXON_ID=180227 /ORGANISM="Neoparamoeba aestuarina, Strain SoJaBio B1-5/56/2" /LENGTH=243 /DNA_ID=CAMNT_0047925527 /DNA_START=60 /DNA_END=791 /DNA_ORIENTATION=+
MSVSNLIKTELAVELKCEACVKAVKDALADEKDIEILEIDISSQRVVLQGEAPVEKICQKIKDAGLAVVVRGQGTESNLGAAVSILGTADPTDVKGLVRIVQLDKETCLIDVSVTGVTPGKHGIAIHTFGDFTRDWESCGPLFDGGGCDEQKCLIGDLGNVVVDENGKGDIILKNPHIKVWDVIGRSFVLHESESRGGKENISDPGIGWGIIARSSGVFENEKKVCLCTGRTIWEQYQFGNAL